MRAMMRVSIPVDKGNAAIKDGSLASTIQAFSEFAKPEAAYFVADAGSEQHTFSSTSSSHRTSLRSRSRSSQSFTPLST